MSVRDSTVLLVPVFNEADNIETLLFEIRQELPDMPVCFINDCSTDGTLRLLRRLNCVHLDLPCNIGVGGAMQAGFAYAFEKGYRYALRLDGDGQHPPSECRRLIERMSAGDMDCVIGSRFLGDTAYANVWYRHLGIRALSTVLSLACRRSITDPTSGFQMVNRTVMYYFAHQYPTDYPEPEALALLSRQGYRFCEVPARFRPRLRGTSSLRLRGAFFYLFKVGVALFVDRCRAVDHRYDRMQVEQSI